MPRRVSTLLGMVFLLAGIAVPPRDASADDAWVRRGGAERILLAAARSGTKSLPRRRILDLASQAYRCAVRKGEITQPILSVIDYSLPSSQKRLWVFDMASGELVFHELVAHGRNSGVHKSYAFSNVVGSKQSSLGLFRTAGTYYGKHGYSLNLVGLEQGVNDNAYERRIVVHGADYVDPTFVDRHGQAGRSWGCPAVSDEVSRPLIDKIKDGSALFAYYPDLDWLDSSTFLRCDGIASAKLDDAARNAASSR